MGTNRASLLRSVLGFLTGAFLADCAIAAIFFSFYSLPATDDPRNHTGEAFALLMLVMGVAGGFIGSRGLSADFMSDLLWPVGLVYGIVIFLCMLSSLSFGEAAIMVGFASVGVAASATGALLLRKKFPPQAG